MERPNLFLSTILRSCHSNLFARIWKEPVCHAPRSLIRVPFCRYDVTLPLRDEIKQTKRGTRFLPFSKKRQVSSGIVFVSFAGFPVSLQEKATWTASTGRVHSRSRFVFVFLFLGGTREERADGCCCRKQSLVLYSPCGVGRSFAKAWTHTRVSSGERTKLRHWKATRARRQRQSGVTTLQGNSFLSSVLVTFAILALTF